jgi:hypothetical protein
LLFARSLGPGFADLIQIYDFTGHNAQLI